MNSPTPPAREKREPVLARVWHEEISGMVAGPCLFPGQTEYVLVADYDRVVAQKAALVEALERQEADLTRELIRLHALMKRGDWPHLMTVWTHLNSMRNGLQAALRAARGDGK